MIFMFLINEWLLPAVNHGEYRKFPGVQLEAGCAEHWACRHWICSPFTTALPLPPVAEWAEPRWRGWHSQCWHHEIFQQPVDTEKFCLNRRAVDFSVDQSCKEQNTLLKKTHSHCWPCSWWWRCRTPRYRCRGILSVWSQPPPWSPPSAPCWRSAASGAEPAPHPSAAPAPIPHAPSPPGPSHAENLQHGTMGEIAHCAPATYPRLTPKKKYSHVCDYTNICPATHTEIHTLDSTLARCSVGFGTPLFSGALRGNSWIDKMRLWTPCRIIGRLLDGFNEKLSLWQREEASLRKIIMQYEYGLRIIVFEVLINSLIALCSQETVYEDNGVMLCRNVFQIPS